MEYDMGDLQKANEKPCKCPLCLSVVCHCRGGSTCTREDIQRAE